MEVSHEFRNKFAEQTFGRKYQHENAETWPILANTLAHEVCGDYLSPTEVKEVARLITEMKFIPGGRYLYYAGRNLRFYNNCFLLRAEHDTREEWGELSKRAIDCLMTGGGIGIDYSVLREEGALLARTGGRASGPIPLMQMINEIGRRVMQGGSRRSAIYASLNWQHPDMYDPERETGRTFMTAKDWKNMPVGNTGLSVADMKDQDYNYHAPLDMTNISPNYDNEFLRQIWGLKDVATVTGMKKATRSSMQVAPTNLPEVFMENVRQAWMTGEPGFSFNFFDKENETLRNACTEVTSEDDSDVCNLGSLNMSQYETIDEWKTAVRLGTYFLVCGTLTADLPYKRVEQVREKNRRLGLGLMGVHEWLMKRGHRYEVVPELHEWLKVYKEESDAAAEEITRTLGISQPVAVRAIAPTGTIGILAGTTTGIEPLFAVAYKRRFLSGSSNWKYEYVIDGTAKTLIHDYDLKPEDIETALDLATDPERRIAFQADVQDYVDQSISSTINVPSFGSAENNITHVHQNALVLAKYAHRLRGFTVYPDGARGGQPLTSVPYKEALSQQGEVFEETMDICDLTKGGSCGV